MRVRVFHNTDAKFGLRGYQHGDRLTVVAVYDDEGAADATAALNRAWTLFNIGDDPAFGEPSRSRSTTGDGGTAASASATSWRSTPGRSRSRRSDSRR